MGSVKVEKFGGQLPAWDDRFIPDDQASRAQNTYLYSGAAVGWRKPKVLRALTNSAAKFAYRVPTITQGVAGANLVFTGNPNPGDTVTVGEITYTFTATPTKPFDVLRSGSTTSTANALFLALNFGSLDPTVVGANTPANPAIAADCRYVGNPFAFVAGSSALPANDVFLVKVIPSGTMQITDVNMVTQSNSPGAHFTGVVYESVHTINAAGTAYTDIPTTLLATGNQAVGCTVGGTVTSHLSVPVTLQGGSTYWVGFILDTGVNVQLASNAAAGVSNANPYTSGPPNPFQTTSLSGVTTGGTTVGSLQTTYNINQPSWQIWGTMAPLSATDPVNTIGSAVINASSFAYIGLQAPAFGTSFNQTPVSAVSPALVWLRDLLAFTDITSVFMGGAGQSIDTTVTGASLWLEFLDQDTNVLRSPVVDDTFQRYYFASPSLPPQYNTYQRIAAGQPAFYLGVPAPPIAPTLVVANGGNPTQIGFPGSSTAATFTPNIVPPNVAQLVLYPVTSSVEVSLVDIGFQLAGVGASGSVNVIGMVFADKSGVPGNIITSGGIVSIGSSTVAPAAAKSTFPTAITLLANTQYWIGVQFALQTVGSTGFTFALSDAKTQGYNATYINLAVDPATGRATAPAMTAGFSDLQVWGDIAVSGTGAQEETRAYVYTWVTAYNEEGPPSPAALLTAFDNATWTVGLQPPLAQDMGTLRNIVKANIYRTMSSVQGGTVFFFVGSVAANTATFVDSITDDVVAANLILPSTTWFGPPATLQGIVTMPNGMMAGFRGNEVWFCEPFRPHAWPAGYVMTTDYPIVGLGVSGTTLVAATDTTPNAFTGTSPNTMSQERISLPEPCISRGGILSTENGVYYPSVNGLIKVTGKTAVNSTQSWITRDKWDQLTPQKFVRAVKNVSTYFAFGTTGVTNGQADASVAQQGFTLELSEVAERTSFSIYPQVGGHRIGFSTLTSPVGANIDNVLADPWSGVTMLIAGGSVYYYDFTDQAAQITPYLWRSKKFQGPHKENFAAFRVWFDLPPGGPQKPPAARNMVPFTEVLATTAQMKFQGGMLGVVRIIADGFYITERELRFSTELMRVASVTKHTTWQIEIEGIVSVTNIKMATTVQELGKMK